MSTRHIALAGALLAIVFLAHAAGRFTQIGGAQVAPSIAIYVLMALLLAPQLGWGPLAGIGLATGILTMLATSSPFPPANIPAHGLGFLVAAGLSKAFGRGDIEVGAGKIIGILAVTLIISWTLFATVSWWGLTSSIPRLIAVQPGGPLLITITWLGFGAPAAGSPLLERSFELFGVALGQGLVPWWIFGFITVAIPTLIIGLVLTPLLYKAVRPALVRQGMLPASEPV